MMDSSSLPARRTREGGAGPTREVTEGGGMATGIGGRRGRARDRNGTLRRTLLKMATTQVWPQALIGVASGIGRRGI